MEITLEQVERLREKANISYARAKQALEYSGGNLLDALIYLEEQGDIPRPEGAYYSTRGQTPPEPRTESEQASGLSPEEKKEVGNFLQRLRYLMLDNELEIWRKERPVTALPVLILILLVVVAWYVTVPLLVLGLFLGFRYRFSGPDLERESINRVMDSVADTAADLGRRVMDELRSQGRSVGREGESEQPGEVERRESGQGHCQVEEVSRQAEEAEREACELERRLEEDLLGGEEDSLK